MVNFSGKDFFLTRAEENRSYGWTKMSSSKKGREEAKGEKNPTASCAILVIKIHQSDCCSSQPSGNHC